MISPDHIHVQAHIPHEDGSRFVVDTEGNRPTMRFDHAEHGTYEGTLHAIVKDVTDSADYGKIDRRDPKLERQQNHIVYRTQTIGGNALRSTAYRWSA